MKIANTIPSLKTIIHQWQQQGLRIGLVPTMGYLHAGHIELVKQAKDSCDKVVVSIYVNPLQFNQASDLEAYPESLEDDKQKLMAVQTDCLFYPDTQMMYPHGEGVTTKICVPGITAELEGEHRPGHFDGVSTVVNKFFNLVQPQVAFFGEKDYQQLLLIKKMVSDLNMAVQIQSVPTYREPDGLAMSSRNSRLSEEQRIQAAQLYQTLKIVAKQLKRGQLPLADIESQAMAQLLAAGFQPEYVSVRDCSSFKPPKNNLGKCMVLAAAQLGNVRLIDNLIVD